MKYTAAGLLILNGVLVCLLPGSAKELKAMFSMSKIKGTITFTQSLLSSPTTMKLDLEGITGLLKLQIHEVPMIYKGGPSTSCSSLGRVFDPTSWNTTDACSSANPGNCAVGDLSGKFISFRAENSKESFSDDYIPLSGKNSIYGRTLLFSASSDVPKACAIITSSQTPSYAVAHFKGPVAGTVYFKEEGSTRDTLVYANLFYVNDATTLKKFFLKIHSNPVNERMTSDQCSNVGQVFNPFSASGVDCSQDNHNACPVGDLKNKIGTISVTIATAGLSSNQLAETDVNLPVNGPNTIIGHSLVLYSVDSPNTPVACTNISKLLPKKAKAVFTREATDGVFGTFKFSQLSPFDPTRVEIDIKNLRSKAEGFHVHEYPNPSYKSITDNAQACSAYNAGDHLNPYGIVGSNSPSSGSGTFDEYEIGDLSAKYGSFSNQNDRTGTYTDWNLPLFGKNSSVGRSIVIHNLKKDGNKRWVCRNIDLDMVDVVKMEARSHFTGPEILGDIVVTQYRSSDDKAAPFDTTFYLDLKRVDGRKSSNHNWHVHDNAVGDDMNKPMNGGRCDSLGPHYNPFGVSLKEPYSTTCTPNNPLRCELGDTSAKTATYDLGSGPRFYSDIDTPLFGEHSVAGRGFLVHSANKGAPRQGCADINPNNTLFKEKTLNILKPSQPFSRSDFIVKMATVLSTAKWRIFYVKYTTTSKCSRISFGIFGDDRANREFDSMVRGNPGRLKPYEPNSECSHSQGLQVHLSLVIFAVLACIAAVL